MRRSILALGVGLALTLSGTASADSGSITDLRPGGEGFVATYTTTSTYCTASGICDWYPYATSGPPGEACDPDTANRIVLYVGTSRTDVGTQTATRSFPAPPGPIKICLHLSQADGRIVTVAEAIYTPPPRPSPTIPATAVIGGDRNCPDFRYQEDAQVFLLPGDPHRLDADRDGIACEELPRRSRLGAPVSPGVPVTSTTPTAALSVREAQGVVRSALRRRYGRRFTRGRGYRRACSRQSLLRARCRVSWRYGSSSYRGTVSVVATGNDRVRYSIRVRRR